MKRLKRIIPILICLAPFNRTFAQLTGGFESNAAWYIDDSKIKLETTEAKDRLRSNNYLRLDYAVNHFTFGIQAEAYLSKALLNYSSKFKGVNIANYYANYKNDSIGIDVTLGHFYEQFGSGLVLRSWEDRQLGIANSIAGIKVKYQPVSSIQLTTLFGRQRNGVGFNFSEGTILGLNSDLNLSDIFKTKNWQYTVGVSYVNRQDPSNFSNLSANTYLTSARAGVQKGAFSADVEYAFKSADALVEFGNIKPDLQFDGDVYLFNTSYASKGFGINANFRRLENFSIYTERKLAGNIYNEAIVNYIPALTKQYDYSLTNIYVYAAQPGISFELDRNKAGEIGGQIDIVCHVKPKTFFGGKYGINVSVNFAEYHGLEGLYDAIGRKYKAELAAFGTKYYHEIGAEIRKKWTSKMTSTFTYLNQFYNARFVEETLGEVDVNTIVLENTIQFKKARSLRFEVQHQWADGGFKNWAAAQVEFNLGGSWSFFAADLYNYGNDEDDKKLHFYNIGSVYKSNAFRLQLSYGRQRGGLVCVGGVCRFVPQSAGLNLALNYSF